MRFDYQADLARMVVDLSGVCVMLQASAREPFGPHMRGSNPTRSHQTPSTDSGRSNKQFERQPIICWTELVQAE
nr:hypothetical protein [uncultured Cohaesibacter sp.]